MRQGRRSCSAPPLNTYVYDSLDQLTRENNQAAGKTWVYNYDNGGNILSKKEYAYTTGALGTVQDTISYGYGESAWKDLLTSYDGQTLTTDAIGNLTNDGTWSYTWQHGRQLAQMSKPNGSGTENVNYTYDAQGHRIAKEHETTGSIDGDSYRYAFTAKYTYLGDTLTDMQWVEVDGSVSSFHFTYDATGPMSMTFYGTEYFYLKNAQGDVTGLVDSSGTQVVAYTYDAWGNILSITGSMADGLGYTNPFRYRGYFYDTETGLYYLGSRYYNPETGRFINADGYVSTDENPIAQNMLSYCKNNPVNRTDEYGTKSIFQKLKDTVRGIISTIVKTVSKVVSRLSSPTSQTAVSNNVMLYGEHKKKGTTSPSNRNKHEEGQARKNRDSGGEKGDARRKPNPNKRRPQNAMADYGAFERTQDIMIMTGVAIVLIFLVGDDIVGGFADDAAIAPTMVILWDSAARAFG